MQVKLSDEEMRFVENLPPGQYATRIVESYWHDGEPVFVIAITGPKTDEPSLFTITKE